MTNDPSKLERPIPEAIRAGAIGACFVAALLLLPAGLVPGGTWIWPRGVAFVAAYGGVNIVGNLALAAWRPAHFRVRRQSLVAHREKRQPLDDAVGTVMTATLAALWVAFIPIDVFRLHILPPPGPWATWIAGAAVVVGAALTPIAVWENRFAAPNVQDQTGDGQRIVDTGVYALVRHPIYLGNLLLLAGAAVWLGSYAALIGVGLFLASTVGRIVVEESHLRARFPEYASYARRVRARLIPLVI